MTIKHITYRGKNVHEIRCKTCGTPIRTMQPHDHPQTTHVRKAADGTIIREVQTVLAVLQHYNEMTLIMQNPEGTMSRHVTHGCKKCFQLLLHDQDMETLQKMHDQDIDAHYYEEVFPLSYTNTSLIAKSLEL